MNSVNLTGRLTTEPELRHLADGTAVCKIRLAADRMGRNNETGYIDVTTFGPSGEAAAKVLDKGWLVAVSGRLQYGQWETDGAKRSAHSVIGHVEFLAAPKDKTDTPPDPDPDDIAF